jgi:prepilin-type N-terminal cleavage/methylation domain-containing protein
MRRHGFTLLELLVVVAVLGVLTLLVVPPLLRTASAVRVELAAGEVQSAMFLARAWAVRRQALVAVKFRPRPDGGASFTLYRDGDRDGVRNEDIDAGVDPRVSPVHTLAHLGRAVRFGFPEGMSPPPRDPADPRRRLDRLDDPIRFNRSDLASFGPLGGSTPGSVYLTDGERTLLVVRVLGRTGRLQIRRYDFDEDHWR